MVFYRVVGASWEHLSHFCPFVAVSSVCQEKDPLLVRHPLDLENAGVQVVVPALSTLFAQPSFHELRDEGPSLRPILLD